MGDIEIDIPDIDIGIIHPMRNWWFCKILIMKANIFQVYVIA